LNHSINPGRIETKITTTITFSMWTTSSGKRLPST
jgi:hypothetical protein